jgi:hypothetical protein
MLCPADEYRPEDYVCRASDGLCDLAESCDVCSLSLSLSLARSRSLSLSLALSLSLSLSLSYTHCCFYDTKGTSVGCPNDEVKEGICRPARGECDIAEFCDGVQKTCPEDEVSVGEICRKAADSCDINEKCVDREPSCPANRKKPEGISCVTISNAKGQCDASGKCVVEPVFGCVTAGDCVPVHECSIVRFCL